jgi:L-ascorbate metabolism protein UlaG (beta-lactamase superfamily)
MKRLMYLALFVALLAAWLAGCATPTPAAPTAEPSATPIPVTATPFIPDVVQKLHWFGTSAYLYNGSQVIYFDPVALSGDLPVADLILITHAHSDHWNVEDLLKIIGPDTTLIISPSTTSVYETAKEQLGVEAVVLKEGESTEVNGVTVRAVPAFDTRFHLKDSGGVGYIVTVDGTSIYQAGGTTAYPEMAENTCDLAILPMYRNNELKEMIALVPAKYFIVMHIGTSASKAYETVLTKEFGPDKLFFTPAFGPYQP